MLEKSIINFFYKKEEFRSLSNFYETDIVIVDGAREYESGEHCFHGEKYIRLSNICDDISRKNILLEYGKKFMKGSTFKGAEVKRMGGKKGLVLKPEELTMWNNISLDVQRKICRYKLENVEEVRNDLLKSGYKILIHPALRCSEEKVKDKFWEGKGIITNDEVKIIGKNMLGNIWMEIRDEYFCTLKPI